MGQSDPGTVAWLLAPGCGYICFFTGVPTLAFPAALAKRARVAAPARRGAGACFRVAMLLPDLVYYVLWQPDVLDLRIGASSAESVPDAGELADRRTNGWLLDPSLGLIGLLALSGLIRLGRAGRCSRSRRSIRTGSAAAAGEPGSADVLY